MSQKVPPWSGTTSDIREYCRTYGAVDTTSCLYLKVLALVLDVVTPSASSVLRWQKRE
jgi:hypothetical protein